MFRRNSRFSLENWNYSYTAQPRLPLKMYGGRLAEVQQTTRCEARLCAMCWQNTVHSRKLHLVQPGREEKFQKGAGNIGKLSKHINVAQDVLMFYFEPRAGRP